MKWDAYSVSYLFLSRLPIRAFTFKPPRWNACVCQASPTPHPPTQINHHTLYTQSVKQQLLYVKEPRVEVCATLSEGFHPLTSFGSDGKAASVRLCVHAPVFIFSSPYCNTAIPPNSLQQVMFTLRFFQMLLPAPTAASGSPARGPLSRSPHADHCRCHSHSRLSLAFCVWELLIYSSFLCRQAHCI